VQYADLVDGAIMIGLYSDLVDSAMCSVGYSRLENICCKPVWAGVILWQYAGNTPAYSSAYAKLVDGATGPL
jgi:hypothetical protein